MLFFSLFCTLLLVWHLLFCFELIFTTKFLSAHMAHNTYFSKQLQHQKACDGQQAFRQMAHFYPEISAVQLYASTPLTRGGSRSAGWIFDGFRMLPSPARCVEVSHGCNKNNNSENLEPVCKCV